MVGSGAPPGDERELARQVGRLLAERGAVVVCGGLTGAMEAACRGAKEGGGTTVGILPGGSRADANPWVDVAVATGIGEARNAIVVRTVDAVIAVGGEWGTLSEIALALKAGKPVVTLRSWEPGKDGRSVEGPERAETPEEAVDRALSRAAARLP